MNEPTPCPSCRRLLRIPESLLGHDVKCPSCGTIFNGTPEAEPDPVPVPVPAGEERLEEVDPAPARQRSSPREQEDRPRRRSRRDEEDEEIAARAARRRTRRVRHTDEDDDDRPRRRYEPHRGPLILTLGICSIFFAHPVLAPLAWILGSSDLAAIRSGRMDPEGESMTQTGRIIGMIVTLLQLTVLLGFCLFFGVMFVMAVAAGGLR
jgi:hypothetical protein